MINHLRRPLEGKTHIFCELKEQTIFFCSFAKINNIIQEFGTGFVWLPC